MTRWEGRATVYRCYDAEKQLLYVGCSGDADERLQAHRTTKLWWPDVHSTTFEHYETRQEGEAAELAAIQTESPLYNVIFNPASTTQGRHPRPPRRQPIHLGLDPATVQQIDHIAQDEGRTRADVIRRLIDDALWRLDPTPGGSPGGPHTGARAR